MIIRPAEINEAKSLSEIARAAKAFWKYPESWLNKWQSALTVTPEFIGENEVRLAENEGKILGFYALTHRGEKFVLEHLWIAPDFIGGGIGKKLLADALQNAAVQGATAIEIESDPHAEGFYRKQGATKIGESKSEIEGKERILPMMKIEISDAKH